MVWGNHFFFKAVNESGLQNWFIVFELDVFYAHEISLSIEGLFISTHRLVSNDVPVTAALHNLGLPGGTTLCENQARA